MSFLNTDKIKVFPSTRRVGTQVDARLMTEASMVGLINQLINKKGFIITPKLNTETGYDPAKEFEFNIHGYYFRINQASDITTLVGNAGLNKIVYAHIAVDNSSTTQYHELIGQDDTNVYKGLYIDLTPPDEFDAHLSNADYYHLKLFKANAAGTKWLIADESYAKFNESSVDLDIDGGIF